MSASPAIAIDPAAASPANGPALEPRSPRVRMRRLADGTRVCEAALRIEGMHCAACSGVIEAALRSSPGVLRADVSAIAERAELRWRPEATDIDRLIAVVHAAGYRAAGDGTPQAALLRRHEQRVLLMRWFVAAFCAMQVMMLATPTYLAGAHDIEPDLRRLLHWGGWVLSLPVLLLSAAPFFVGAWRGLRQRQLSMDAPVALGLLVTFVASSVATFHPGGWLGSEVYFDSLTMFVAFVLGARWLELRARHRAAEQLEQAVREVEQPALRIDADGVTRAVNASELAVGDCVRVALGQSFPADGRLIEGATAADESLLTGEASPLDKPAGASVVAGSLNVGAPVTMRVERVGDDTALQSIVELVRSAASQRPAVSRWADRWAAPFLWAVLLLAAGAAAAWSVIDPQRAVWVAVAVLIVTCPCALSLAVPASLLAAAGALARRGILLRRLDAIDTWSRVTEVFLDKTGTLTEDALALRRVVPLAPADLSAGEVRALTERAAALARWSAHPLARALAAAHPRGQSPWADVHERPGAGLSGHDESGRQWRLGSARHAGVPAAAHPDADTTAGAALWFGCAGGPWLRMEFDESLRPDAAELVAHWRADGVRVTLLSGDRRARADAVGRALGVDAVIAEATPQDKLQVVTQAQARGAVVAMLGDGINDAPVLAQADLALVMGQGALLARAQSDAVITSERLADLDFARRLARRTRRVVQQNLAWAAGYNLLCVPLALSGLLPPWAAGLGMALSSLGVIGNAWRLSRAR
jgi:Cu2+-exporting ATPase